jgi:hypothetical protein
MTIRLAGRVSASGARRGASRPPYPFMTSTTRRAAADAIRRPRHPAGVLISLTGVGGRLAGLSWTHHDHDDDVLAWSHRRCKHHAQPVPGRDAVEEIPAAAEFMRADLIVIGPRQAPRSASRSRAAPPNGSLDEGCPVLSVTSGPDPTATPAPGRQCHQLPGGNPSRVRRSLPAGGGWQGHLSTLGGSVARRVRRWLARDEKGLQRGGARGGRTHPARRPCSDSRTPTPRRPRSGWTRWMQPSLPAVAPGPVTS